ncbi:hypothetical protein [Flavobacterium sp.]|uniref:hypothetical protein n=1 Tax=Flavobacterium sp. TaxID=239 RepID=UPI00260373FB|nr:hypothetical protein [Flavobacterium sp.]MDD2986137.1 hypothetical protein [Flavobacterium sp.]
MEENRWNPYVLLQDESVKELWRNHFYGSNKKVLFILGKGFDVRMNLGIQSLIEICPNIDLDCLLIGLDEGKDSSSHKLQDLVDENIDEINSLLVNQKIIKKELKLWSSKGKKKVKIGDREASNLIEGYEEIKNYTDIIVDISALPRGVYFSLIGKLLTLIDKYSDNTQNLFVCISENAKIDELTKEKVTEGDVNFLHGFGGGIEITSEIDKPLVWFPILGEEKLSHVRKAFGKITETKNRLYEICPTFPFPSKDPRRSDSILIEYHELLFDELGIEPQNIMYISERNPFEAYIQLSNAIKNYKKSLEIIKGCKAALSNFSSKLLSIGTLLAAYENRDDIGVLNVDSQGYDYVDKNEVKKIKLESELFVTWLTGEPYND